MPNQSTPADEFGYTPHADMPNASAASSDSAASSGNGSTFRQKAEEFIGGERVREFADAAAGRVNATTDYLRNAGATRMRDDVEHLVKKNPGPAMLVAITVGFLIGRSLNRHS